MPKISDFISPVNSASFREPAYLAKGERMNSANTFLNNLFGNYYDAGLRDYETQEGLRFDNQTGWNTFFNFAGNMGLRTLKAPVALASGFTSLGYGLVNLMDGNPKTTFSEGYDANLLRDLNESLNYSIDDVFPTFREMGFNERTFGQQLSNPGQLATQNREVLGMSIESAIGGAAIGAFKWGTRLTSMLAKPMSYTKLFETLKPNNYAKIASILDNRIASTLLRTHESGAEAHDAWKTTIDNLKDQRERGLNDYTDEQIAQMADQNFGNVFASDMVLGAITDTAFIRLFRPILSKGSVSSRANKFGAKLVDTPTLDTFVDEAPAKVTGFKKYMQGRLGDYGKLAKEGLLQAFSEGMEENIQYSNQKVNEGNNSRQSWLENAQAAMQNLVNEGIFITDEERMKAVGLGALMGTGSTVATSLPIIGAPFGGGVLGEAKNERLQKQKAKEDLNKAYTDFVNTSLIEKEPDTEGKLVRQEQEDGTIRYFNELNGASTEIDEDQYNTIKEQTSADENGSYKIPGKIKLDEQGRVVKDLAKAAEFTASMKFQGELDNLIDLEAIKQNPDPIKLKLFELEKLSNLAQTAFRTGTTDLLMKKLDSFKDMGQESLQRFGIDSIEEVNSRIDFFKEHVAKLEANYLQTTNGMIANTYGEKDEVKFQMLKNYTGGIGNRIVNLYSLIDDLDKQIGDTMMKIPNKEKAGWIMTAFETNNLEGRENQSPTTSPEEIRLAELVTKKKDLKEAIEDLGRVYDKLTNPKTGFSEYKRLAAADKLSEYKTLRDGPKVFKADENTTPKNLLSFVAKRANMLKQKNKLDTARTMFYADSLNDLVNYINLNSEKLDDVVDSVLDVYEKLTQSGTFIYPDKAAKLKEIINSVEDLLNQREQQLLEQAGAEGQSLSDVEEDLVNQQMELGFEGEELSEDLQKLLSDIIELSNLRTKLGNKEQLFEKIDAQVASYDISRPDSAFVEDVLDELIQGPRRILEVAEFQDGVISEFYDDVAAVQKQLDFAKALQEKALSKIEEKPYQQASKSLEEVITDLETVLELTKQNLRNLDIKNKKEDLHYAEAVLSFSDLSDANEVVASVEVDQTQADIERRRQEELFGNITSLEFETTDTKGRTRKTTVKTKINENGFKYLFETTVDGKSSSTAYPKVTKQEFKNSSIYENLDQNSKDYIDELPEDAVILLQSIAISTDKNSAAGLGNGNITIGHVSKEEGGRIDDIVLKYQPNQINAKYDAEIEALKSKSASPKTKVVKDISLAQLIESDPILGSMAVMDLVAEEQLSKNIFVALEEEFRKLLNGLDFINNLGDKLSGTPAKYDASIKDEAVKNPLRGIYEIFKIIEKKEPDKTLIEPLIAFNKDYDVIKFKESIKNYKGQVPQQTLLDLLNIHAKFVAINQIRDSENSNFSHVFFLTKIREYLKTNPTAPVPSSSQIRVVRELVTFASSPVIQDAEIFENGAALKAPAGAGKSLVVSKLFNYVMGYTAEEIRSAAAFSRAADNIANSLGHPNEAKTIQELTEQLENGTLSEKVKFLIVDEAGPISRTYINAFVRAVNKHNRTAKNKVKYLFLYDPNQPTAGNISRPAIDDGYITDFAGTELDYHQGTPEVQQEYRKGIRFQNPNSDAMRPMALSQNLKQITSLSTTYRSGVSEVVDLQNAYKSAKTVSEVSTASSLDPNVSMTNIFGTFAESGSSIVKKFAESQAANPSRSRVIVVGNQAKAQQYKKALPNADVVVANEVVGITVDEVYVDMTDTDNENFKSPEFFNQWMYAAISRATSYVHLANYPNATHFVDPKVAPAPRKETLNEDAIKNLDEQIKILSEITGVQVTQKQAPSKKDTVKDDSTTDETPDGPGKANTAKDNDGTSQDTTKQPAKEGGKHALQNPGFTVFDTDEDNGIQGLLPGDELMVFIDNSPKADGTPAERVVIVRKIVPESGRTFYQLTGVLADKEVEDFEKNVGIDTSRLPKYKLDKTSIYNLYKVDGEVTGHETLYVQPGSEGIKYVYDGKPQEDLADMMDADGNVSAAPLLEKYINEVWGKDMLDDYAEVIKNFHKYVKIVTFKSEAEARKVFKDVEARKLPRPGVPYLIIKDIKLKTGSVAKPQFIQLSTKPVNASSEAYKPLYTFIEKIRKFEELLENSAYLPDVYRTMKLGFPVTQAGEKFFPMHAFIKLLSDAHYDASMDTLSILTEKQKTGFGNLFPDLNRTVMSPELLQLAAEIDELIHGDLNRTRDEKGKIKKDKRDFKGDAQKIFDEIGSQNLVASIDNGEQAGKLLLLRDYKSEYIQDRDGQTKQKPIIKGISLLGNVTFIRKDDKGANNPLMSETLVSRLKLYAASLENRNLTETARYKALTQFLNLVADKSKVPHSNVLTSQDLLDLFVGSKDASGNLTNVSGGFGLRTPSPKNVNYKEDSSILDQPVSDFVSHLSKINKTKLIVAKTRDAIDSVETVKATNARMHSLRVAAGIETLSANDIRDSFDAEVIAEFVSKLKKNTLEEALALFRENAKQKFYYTTNSNKILQAILSRLNRQQVTKEYVRQDLLDSLDVLENYLENKVASRDFLRASVLMRILGVKAAEAKDVFPLLDFVRTNYFSPEQRDEFGFSVDFMGLMNTYETDISTIIPRVNEIIEAYREIAAEYGIEYNVRPIDPNAPLDIVYQMIEDGLIFSLLEGSFTIDGQYIRGITSLGIEIRRKHRANEINLEDPFYNIVSNTAANQTDITEIINNTPDDKVEQKVEEVMGQAANAVTSFADKLLTWINNNPNADSADVIAQAYDIDDTLGDEFVNNYDPNISWSEFLKDVIARGTIERSKTFLSEDASKPLSMQEVQDLTDRYTPKNFFTTLREALFGKGPRELIKIVEYGQLVNNQGKQVWGLYKNGVMHFAKLASGGVSSRVVRHELFHKVFWEYLTPSEQIAALSLAREKYGNLSAEALEEALAEEFEDFVVTKRQSFLSRLWSKLKRLLGFSYNNMKSIEEFFNLIENKAFYRQVNGFEAVERSSTNIRTVFNDYAEFRIVKDLILEHVVKNQVERRKAEKDATLPVKSFSELTVDAMAYLEEVAKMDSSKFPDGYTPDQINTIKRAVNKALNNKNFLKNFNDDYFSDTNNRADFVEFLKGLRDRRLEEIRILKEDISKRLEEGEEVSQDEIDALESGDDSTGISDEVLDSMLVDPKTKLTGSIKQRLISIEYYVGSIKHYADLATAFTLIVPKVASIPKGNLREALEALKTTFGNPSIKSRPNIKQAVTNHMANVATDLLAKMDDPTMPKNIAFRKDASHKFLYAIVDTQGGDATLVTRNDLESNPERYREFVIEAGSQVDSIINEISEITNTPKTNVAKVYYFYEDMDFVKSLLASVGSLRKSKPFVWQKSFKFVFRMSGYVVRTSGGKRTFTANVEFAFNKYVAKAVSELRETLFSQELKDGIAKAKTTRDLADKRKAIMVFLKDIGVTKKLTEASTRSIELVFERISQSLDTIQNNYSTALQKKRTLTNAENEDELTGSSLLEDEKGLLDEIADMINSHYTLAESGSYTRGDGKKAYGWIDASWQTDIFNIFQRIREGLPFKKVSIFDVKGSTVTTNDIFLKDNIFFNKQNEIFETVDHDSVKWKDGSKFAKTLRKESLKEFRERNIAGNFFVTLATKAGKYYQTLPIPSNRTSVQAVLVNGLVDQRSIDDALKTIIKAQKNRPNPDAKNPDGSLAHPELNNSKTYRERWKEFTFAGLNGNVDSMTESQAIRAIKEHVNKMVSGNGGLFEAFKESLGSAPEVQIPTWAVIKVANILRIKAPLKWDSQWSDEQKNQFFKDKNAAVEAALKVFYFNYIINQYSLSQIAYGDEAFYKSKEDQTKRIQIATATGDTLLVDERFGIPKNSRVLVVEDLKKIVDPTLHDMLASSYDQEYEASDAEGFMLPEFYEKLASAYGFDANTDVVLKPVYFSIEKGIPTAIKYSVKVLTPELIKQYPHLASYAEAMRAKGVDQMVFASAVKIGSPAVKAKLDDSGRIIASSLDEKAIVNINNENLRFQLNPAKNVDASVANKSQGTAMMNTNGKNTSEAFEMHKANAFVIENGLRTLSRQLRLTRKGGVTKGTETKIRKMLTSVLDGLPGGRDVFEMLSLGSGRNKVALDMPLIGDRVLSTLSAIFTKATTGFRFPGSKLVLQADLGPVMIDGVMRNLKWRDENGFCEVILPETYRPYVEQIKDGIIGFRIPTSNYHSLVPLKVVGFYPVPPGSKGNVIIAPSLIVYYHGSDYDIDTLFVARKDYPNETINLNDFLREIDSEHQDSDNYIIEGGQPYGYKDNVPVDINGYKLYEALDKYIIAVNKQLESFTKQLQNATENQKVALEEAIKTKELVLEKISSIAESAAKNFIVHNFSTNMRDMKNRKDLLTPISFDKIITLRSELKKELSEKLDDDKFLQTLEESGLIKQICQ